MRNWVFGAVAFHLFAFAPAAQADVRVFFTQMSVNDCNEIGTCDWKLSCGLGNQQQIPFFEMAEANTNESVSINRALTQREFPPVTVTCEVQEHDGGIGAEWEQVGSGSVLVRTTGDHLLRLNQHRDEGDVTVRFVAEAIGATGQPLTVGGWTQTPASDMGDVAVGADGRVWLAGRNGTIWTTGDGASFTQVEASGFERVAAGPDGSVWAVGSNGTLWRLANGQWTQTPASDMGDVAVAPDGRIWLAGRNGTIWTTADGAGFAQIEASGFSRVAAGPDGSVWAVGSNGTLWRLANGQWTQTPASDMGDVAVAADGTVWLAGRNGTIWSTRDGGAFTQVEASGFESLAAAPDGAVWAVGGNGTLWRLR